MLQAANADSKRIESHLRELLDRSDTLLTPLSDPLRADLGLNRWLQSDYEEAYSDWLAWTLQQLDSGDVIRLLSIGGSEIEEYCRNAPFRIRRELVIPEGRLDLLIQFGEEAFLIVEVKTTSADSAETAKQRGYCEWLDRQSAGYKPRPVLLAVDAKEDDYEGFRPLRWADLCTGLRRMLPDLQERIGLVKTAMVTAFIGAVEENLLHLTVPSGTRQGSSLFYRRTMEHLQDCLE